MWSRFVQWIRGFWIAVPVGELSMGYVFNQMLVILRSVDTRLKEFFGGSQAKLDKLIELSTKLEEAATHSLAKQDKIAEELARGNATLAEILKSLQASEDSMTPAEKDQVVSDLTSAAEGLEKTTSS